MSMGHSLTFVNGSHLLREVLHAVEVDVVDVLEQKVLVVGVHLD